jgi:hypothetical protein
VNQNLRGLFAQALDAEPAPPPGDLARAAMAQGARLRRRRHLVGGAATAASLGVAAVAAVNLAGGPAPAVTAPAAVPGAPAVHCSAASDRWAPRVSIFLRMDVTDAQRAALDATLGGDRRVRDHHYESPEAAFEKFKVLWRDDPTFVDSVAPAQLPASFRVELANPRDYPAIRAELDGLGGVEHIEGTAC